MIRHSSCFIFQKCWYDKKRIFLKNAPEDLMRDSLHQFLHGHMRGDVEVRPEQNIDGLNPVDIKVTWFNSNRLALIEIKWLGKSRTETSITANHTEARARAGAQQLADYLQQNKPQSPLQTTRGYPVVIDARRGNTKLTTETLPASDGMKYAASEIEYSPKFHEQRSDFEIPIRMFAEPVID